MANILLVDDDSDILVLGKTLLSAHGHIVVTFDNVIDALENTNTNHYDLIITDANMAPRSGYDFIRTLRQNPKHASTPIAMMTSRNTRLDVERAIQSGAQDYIVKPIDPKTLTAKVNELLFKSQADRRTAKFSELRIKESFHFSVPAEVVALNENSIQIQSVHRIAEGTLLLIDTPTLHKIGLQHLQIKIQTANESLEVSSGGTKQFEMRGGILGLDERSRLRLRNYLLAHAHDSPGKKARSS